VLYPETDYEHMHTRVCAYRYGDRPKSRGLGVISSGQPRGECQSPRDIRTCCLAAVLFLNKSILHNVFPLHHNHTLSSRQSGDSNVAVPRVGRDNGPRKDPPQDC
jgi:hypothetical protein